MASFVKSSLQSQQRYRGQPWSSVAKVGRMLACCEDLSRGPTFRFLERRRKRGFRRTRLSGSGQSQDLIQTSENCSGLCFAEWTFGGETGDRGPVGWWSRQTGRERDSWYNLELSLSLSHSHQHVNELPIRILEQCCLITGDRVSLYVHGSSIVQYLLLFYSIPHMKSPMLYWSRSLSCLSCLPVQYATVAVSEVYLLGSALCSSYIHVDVGPRLPRSVFFASVSFLTFSSLALCRRLAPPPKRA